MKTLYTLCTLDRCNLTVRNFILLTITYPSLTQRKLCCTFCCWKRGRFCCKYGFPQPTSNKKMHWGSSVLLWKLFYKQAGGERDEKNHIDKLPTTITVSFTCSNAIFLVMVFRIRRFSHGIRKAVFRVLAIYFIHHLSLRPCTSWGEKQTRICS